MKRQMLKHDHKLQDKKKKKKNYVKGITHGTINLKFVYYFRVQQVLIKRENCQSYNDL